jgi:hypothetical protein
VFTGNLFGVLTEYFASSGDQVSKVVDFPHFTPDVPTQFLNGSERIYEGSEGFAIIDPFAGVMPVVLNHEFLIQKQQHISFTVNILLDSNVVSYLHRYVSDVNGKFRITPRGVVTHKLIRRLAEYSKRGWKFNALFYLLEAASKNDFQTVYPHAAAYSESVRTLQLMDSQVFLNTGLIEIDENKQREFSRYHHSGSVETIAASDVLYFSTGQLKSEVHDTIQLIYSALLMIVVVSRESCPPAKKVEKFFRFMQEKLGVHCALEAFLACLKFGGRAGTFLSTKRDTNETRRSLLASAWDLFLLRLPELLIINEGCERTSVSYVCTADKALEKLGKIRTIERIHTGNLRVPTLFRVDTTVLEQQVGRELAHKYVDLSRSMVLDGAARVPIQKHMIKFLISDLLKQL